MARNKKSSNNPIENNTLKDLNKIEQAHNIDAVNKWHSIDEDVASLDLEIDGTPLAAHSDKLHEITEKYPTIGKNDTMKGTDLIKYILDNHLLDKDVFIFHPKCDDFYFLSKDIISTDRNKMIIHLS